MIDIRVPSSKSLTQRALFLAALGDQSCMILAPLDCDDSQAMRAGLGLLGVTFALGPDRWVVTPPAAFRAPSAPLMLGNAGTAVRFLTSLAPLVPGPMVIDGNDAMRKRPMPGLLRALTQLGVAVEEQGNPACPPVRLTPRAVAQTAPSARVRLQAAGSSQELSGLLMAGCRLAGGLTVEVIGTLPSQPYVDLTLQAMRVFGVVVDSPGGNLFTVAAGRPACDAYEVEGDWSSASYPLAAGWLTGKPVKISNVRDDSVQGDKAFPAILTMLALPGPRRIDMSQVPDLAPTVAACALFAGGETIICGAAHLRIKESDRIGCVVRELRKLGARIDEAPDGMVIGGAALAGPAMLDPSSDHRLAMAFGLVSLRVAGIDITDRACVSKSYPGFWQMLERFR
jgi:3-phosphoshikimate 1-carboxyvinyltransferase